MFELSGEPVKNHRVLSCGGTSRDTQRFAADITTQMGGYEMEPNFSIPPKGRGGRQP